MKRRRRQINDIEGERRECPQRSDSEDILLARTSPPPPVPIAPRVRKTSHAMGLLVAELSGSDVLGTRNLLAQLGCIHST